jgi:hypothetical protein
VSQFAEGEAKRCSSSASIVSLQEMSTRHCFSEEIREATACVSGSESHPVRRLKAQSHLK